MSKFYTKPYTRFPDAGELTKRVVFYQRRDEPREGIFTQEQKRNKCPVWGKLIPVSDTLRINSYQINNAVTHKIITRYKKTLLSSDEAMINGVVYRIRGVIDINSAGLFLCFSCEEVRSQAESGASFG